MAPRKKKPAAVQNEETVVGYIEIDANIRETSAVQLMADVKLLRDQLKSRGQPNKVYVHPKDAFHFVGHEIIVDDTNVPGQVVVAGPDFGLVTLRFYK